MYVCRYNVIPLNFLHCRLVIIFIVRSCQNHFIQPQHIQHRYIHTYIKYILNPVCMYVCRFVCMYLQRGPFCSSSWRVTQSWNRSRNYIHQKNTLSIVPEHTYIHIYKASNLSIDACNTLQAYKWLTLMISAAEMTSDTLSPQLSCANEGSNGISLNCSSLLVNGSHATAKPQSTGQCRLMKFGFASHSPTYIHYIYHVHSYASWHIVPRNFKPSAAQSLHLLWNSYPSSLAILFAKLMQLVRQEVHIKLLISQKIKCRLKCSNNDVISYILGIFDTLIIFERPRVTFSMQIKYRWYIWSRDQQYYCKNEEWHLKNR